MFQLFRSCFLHTAQTIHCDASNAPAIPSTLLSNGMVHRQLRAHARHLLLVIGTTLHQIRGKSNMRHCHTRIHAHYFVDDRLRVIHSSFRHRRNTQSVCPAVWREGRGFCLKQHTKTANSSTPPPIQSANPTFFIQINVQSFLSFFLHKSTVNPSKWAATFCDFLFKKCSKKGSSSQPCQDANIRAHHEACRSAGNPVARLFCDFLFKKCSKNVLWTNALMSQFHTQLPHENKH